MWWVYVWFCFRSGALALTMILRDRLLAWGEYVWQAWWMLNITQIKSGMLHGLHALDAFSLELKGRLDDLYFDLGKGWILSRTWQHKLVLNGQEKFFFLQLRLTSRVQKGLCVLKFRNKKIKTANVTPPPPLLSTFKFWGMIFWLKYFVSSVFSYIEIITKYHFLMKQGS